MNILAVDQARHGAWAVFDYEEKSLVDYGTWAFESKNHTFEQAILHIEALINEVIHTRCIDAVFFEDIQLRKNVQSFRGCDDSLSRAVKAYAQACQGDRTGLRGL